MYLALVNANCSPGASRPPLRPSLSIEGENAIIVPRTFHDEISSLGHQGMRVFSGAPS
jgi:hypothetical protein